ncbi:DUF1699 family protein [uncultured Methanolobus sp.]|uniref:DUF1699 family protein n=1 Tax=uncultured Methanolobus sp. TaxID=218300 RepID=UPI002AAAFB27|nr:DUF1699 family protein [uncultured Methanolobus sp.]
MKIRVVSSKEEISTLGTNEEIIHLAFRPSNTDILELITRCPKVKALHIPASYKRTISHSSIMFLEMQGIDLVEGDVWGHRKDINDYSEVSQRIYDLIDEYKEKGMSEEEIVDKMTREEMHMSKDLLRFIIKSRM